MHIKRYFLKFSLLVLFALFAGTGFCAASFDACDDYGEILLVTVSDNNLQDETNLVTEPAICRNTLPDLTSFHKSLKRKIKVRGYGATFIQLPSPVFYSEKLVPNALIGGMAAYTLPYFLSSQYSFLFRLTPF